MSDSQTPKPRRRIAGEAKPGDVGPAPTAPKKVTLAKPKLGRREAPAEPTRTGDLPAAPPRAEAPRVARQKPSALLLGLIALAVAACGFGAYGVWHGIDQWRDNNVADAREAAADAAAGAAETIFTYRYDQMGDNLRKSQDRMTPTFAKKFATGHKALSALAPQRKVQLKAVVRNAATLECGTKCAADRAQVLVFTDWYRLTEGDERPTVFSHAMKFSMVELDGKWRVNNMATVF